LQYVYRISYDINMDSRELIKTEDEKIKESYIQKALQNIPISSQISNPNTNKVLIEHENDSISTTSNSSSIKQSSYWQDTKIAFLKYAEDSKPHVIQLINSILYGALLFFRELVAGLSKLFNK
jgi:hypothetical protein